MVFFRLVGHPTNGGREDGWDELREVSVGAVGGMANDQELGGVVVFSFLLSF